MKMDLSTEEFLKTDFGNTVYKKSTSGFNGGKFNTKTRNAGEKRKLPPISDDCSMKKTSTSMSVVNGDKKTDGVMILPYVPVVSVGHSTSSLISTNYQSSSWEITPVYKNSQSLVTKQNIIYKPDHKTSKDRVHIRNGSSYEGQETFEKERADEEGTKGVQIRMAPRASRRKPQTVRQLIDELSKKHEKLMLKESDSVRSLEVNDSSSSSPSVPYSTADILYNGETTRSSITDDYSPNDLVYSDKVSGRLKENNDNKRPNSRNTSRRSISLEKVSINGDRDDLQAIKTSTISKSNHFRPTGIRQSYLRGEQLYSNNNSPSKTGLNSSSGNGGVQKEDLVAMGTLWNPNTPKSNGVAVSNSKQYPNGGSNTLPPRRGGPSTSRFTMGTGSSRQPARDVEPKYTDPAIGATNSFQQRLIDLSSLEGETVRWERSKKVKKKPKQDRDS